MKKLLIVLLAILGMLTLASMSMATKETAESIQLNGVVVVTCIVVVSIIAAVKIRRDNHVYVENITEEKEDDEIVTVRENVYSGSLGDIVLEFNRQSSSFISFYVPHTDLILYDITKTEPKPVETETNQVNPAFIKKQILTSIKSGRKNPLEIANMLSIISKTEDTSEFLEENPQVLSAIFSY